MLKGTLDDFTLPDIFRLMSLAKKTGRMDVSRGAGQGRVFFNDGDVYYAESSLSREPLGQKLIRARALTESQLNKALDVHAQTGKRVGDIMIESGMVTSDQIEAAVAQQIEDAVFDLLRWDLGEFTWEGGAELEVEVPISVSVENLIMEASRRLDELEVIQRKIPGEHAVLMMAPAPPEGAAEINITPEEWRALVLVDGSRTVGDIGLLIGKDDFETMKILYGLVSAGLVEVDHEATVAATESATQPGEDAAVAAEAVADEAVLDEAVLDEAVEMPDEAAVAEVVEDAPVVVDEPAIAEDAVEVEVVAAEPGPADELEGLLEGPPAAETTPPEVAAEESMETMPEAPDLDVVAAAGPEADAEAEVVDIGAETGVPGDEVIDAGGFDMTSDELLAGDSAAEEEAPAEAEAVASNGIADLVDPLQDVPQPPDEIAVPGLEDTGEPAATETVSVGDAEDPFLSDLLDQDAAVPAPEDVTEPTAEPVAEDAAEEEDSPTVDRAAVVRELAGLFDEDRPKARPAGPSAPPAPGGEPPDQRKRVEDDDQINKGVISRLIKGVKGL